MKTTSLTHPFRRSVLVLAGASLLGLTVGLFAAKKSEPVYENYIDISAGYIPQTGDRAGFQKAYQQNQKGALGIEDLFYTKQLNDDTTLTLRGHAMSGNADYLLDLAIAKDDVGYVKFGYKAYRVWFDGTGGYFPPNGFNIRFYDENLHLDRSNLWFEAGYIPADKLNFIFRYDLYMREGQKDSTSWGDTALAVNSSNLRGLLPSFYQIDEKRHQLTATLSKLNDSSSWDLGVRYDKGDYTNSRNERRRATESTDRIITHKEGRDYDLFMMRGSYINQIHEKLRVTTAVMKNKIDSTLSGTRIYGPDYDPIYDATWANRQQRDEGFIHLGGETEMKQTVGTISALYMPNEDWAIVPSFRAEKIDWSSVADFIETNFTSARVADNTELESHSDKSWENLSESVEARYKGLKNVSLNFKGEWVQATGDLNEKEVDEPGTPAQAVTIDRDTAFDRDSQKYSATANWYAAPGMTVAVQYYYKARQNDYRSTRDGGAPALNAGDRYPAYVANQDFETNDFNARLSWRASSKVRTITRYDYQKSTIRSQDVGLAMADSAKMTSHILSETISVNPLTRWYLQGTVNYVWDQLTTPAVGLTGAAADRVKNSDANYVNFSLGSGYAIDTDSDVYVDYSLYRAFNDFIDNSASSVAYGTKARSQQVGVTWFRQLDRRTSLTLRYAYAQNKDEAVGTLADYKAHLIYAKVQYRF